MSNYNPISKGMQLIVFIFIKSNLLLRREKMKLKVFSLILVVSLLLTGSLQAQTVVSNFQFSATATILGKVSFTVDLSNTVSPTILAFGTVPLNNTPLVAQNAGQPSYAKISYECTYSTWRIKCYTDNFDASANPRYVGPQPGYYGEINDGTGLIRDDGTGSNVSSTPIKVWSDVKAPDGSYAKAPCQWWDGSGTGISPDVPNPAYEGQETGLYWVNRDLNGNSTNTDAIFTNAHWAEADVTPAYDANGDGDTLDDYSTLGKVLEYSPWLPVCNDPDVVTGATTCELMNSEIACGVITSQEFKAYFAITDDVGGGAFATDQLYFELYVP